MSKINTETIGGRLKFLREKSRLTQCEAIQELYITESELSRIENGKDFSVQTLILMCSLYDISSDYILFGTKNSDSNTGLSGLSTPDINLVKSIISRLNRS